VPTGLAATAGSGTVSLNWNNNTEVDLAGYNVYRSTTSGSGYGKLNGSPLGSSDYADNSVTNGTTYYYVVTAVDTGSNESGDSSEVSATPELRTDVEIIGSWVSGTTHTKGSGTDRALIFIAHGELITGNMTLASVTYGGQAMTKVIDRNYYGNNGTAYAAAFILKEAGVAAATTSTFTPTWSGTQPTASGYASVFFGNVDQTSSIGASASGGSTSDPVTTAAIATNDGDMVINAATCGNQGSYTLNNSFIEGTDQTMGGTATGVTGRKLATGAAETPSADYSSTVNRQTIIGFVVKAAAVDLPPAAPTSLSATAGNGTVSLDWNNNAESDLAGYNVYRSTTSGSGYSKQNTSLVSSSDYIDNTVTNGIPYFYVVTAVDTQDNESGYSNETSSVSDYQNCLDVQNGGDGLLSDLNGDCFVNLEDLEIISTYWLEQNCGSYDNCEGADFAPIDGTVDFVDFSDFAVQWMQCNDPETAGCTANW